jgi:hypothetical protein
MDRTLTQPVYLIIASNKKKKILTSALINASEMLPQVTFMEKWMQTPAPHAPDPADVPDDVLSILFRCQRHKLTLLACGSSKSIPRHEQQQQQ